MESVDALWRVKRAGYQMGGRLGETLSAVVEQWLLVAPLANPAMLEMFADRDVRPYRDLVPWAGEFAGKYLTSAVQVLRATGDERLRTWLGGFVDALVSLQDGDGYLGPWPQGSHLTGTAPNVSGGGATWDAWGHYHILLGLLLWHEETGNATALVAARRIGDLLCDAFLGAQSPRLVDTGESDKNLAPVHGLALLYTITGEDRYRGLAEQLVQEFSAAGPHGPLAGDYLRLALAGRAFHEMPKPRWESLHSIMGMAELYRATGHHDYREAYERIWWSIVRNDRHNNGGFTSDEQATGNPYRPGAIETCCTIAWMAASVEMLKLTGNSVVADELELSTLNAVLGMHAPSGRWATYNTPSDGARFASAHQIVFQARSGSPELNCCSVNSPRGLGMVSDWAIMQCPHGLTINYYGASKATFVLEDGMSLSLHQETDYPASGRILLHVAPSRATELTLHLRIPAWSTDTAVDVNGVRVEGVVAGTYLAVRRHWQEGDTVELNLDLGPHLWVGDHERAGLASIYYGPILLAYDQRDNRARTVRPEPTVFGADPWKTTGAELAVPDLDPRTLIPIPVAWDDWFAPWLLFEVSTVDGTKVRLCDFASAGRTGSLYRSWLPCASAPERPPFTREHPLLSVGI